MWYSVRNHGDGSAYPEFFESKELADWDQEDEEWGESCTGLVPDHPKSAVGCFLELVSDDGENLNGFIAEFLKGGLPDLSTVREENSQFYNIVDGDGKLHYRYFAERESEARAFLADVVRAFDENIPQR